MKTAILRVTIMMALVVGVTAVSAQAQTVLNGQKFTVPFEFNIGNEVLPAGEYTVFVENQTIRLRKSDGKANAIAVSQRTLRASNVNIGVKLTFRQYGDQVYLSQVWSADGVGRELKKQRKEYTTIVQKLGTVEVQGQTR